MTPQSDADHVVLRNEVYAEILKEAAGTRERVAKLERLLTENGIDPNSKPRLKEPRACVHEDTRDIDGRLGCFDCNSWVSP